MMTFSWSPIIRGLHDTVQMTPLFITGDMDYGIPSTRYIPRDVDSQQQLAESCDKTVYAPIGNNGERHHHLPSSQNRLDWITSVTDLERTSIRSKEFLIVW